jgi:hypothetical protein
MKLFQYTSFVGGSLYSAEYAKGGSEPKVAARPLDGAGFTGCRNERESQQS